MARADGTYGRLLGQLARLDVLLLDDWGLAPPQEQERRDLLEVLDDRAGTRSTIVTSQLPPRPMARSHRRPDAGSSGGAVDAPTAPRRRQVLRRLRRPEATPPRPRHG